MIVTVVTEYVCGTSSSLLPRFILRIHVFALKVVLGMVQIELYRWTSSSVGMWNVLANGLGKGIMHGDSIVCLEGLVLEQDLGRDGRTAQLVVVSLLCLSSL
jgi:hypothetical protein